MRGFIASLRGRLRHGQAMQEILDRLARRGIVVYPYLVFEEPAVREYADPPGLERLRVRRLTAGDAPQLAALASKAPSERRAAERLARGEVGIGAFDGDELIAYTWCALDELRGFGRNVVLRALAPDEACLAKSWVLPAYRGRGIVIFLRREVNAAMEALGRHRLCSASLYFNRSARRLKAKVGARATELRLALALPGGLKRDLLIKQYPRSDGG